MLEEASATAQDVQDESKHEQERCSSVADALSSPRVSVRIGSVHMRGRSVSDWIYRAKAYRTSKNKARTSSTVTARESQQYSETGAEEDVEGSIIKYSDCQGKTAALGIIGVGKEGSS